VRCTGDARGSVHVEADVAFLRYTRFAGVETHSDADRPGAQVALRLLGRKDGICCGGKCDEERVALRVDFDTAVARERLRITRL
jgi:hypothetical protein